MSTHMSDAENLADLVSRIKDPEDAKDFQEFKNIRTEACFDGRLFVIYRPQGLNADKTHRDPEVLTTLRINSYSCDGRTGPRCTVTDIMTDQTLELTTIPQRLFNHPVFACIPPFSKIRWDARYAPNSEEVKRSLGFAITLKTRNRSDHYSLGNTYCETPNDFRSLFPNYNLSLRFA